MSGNHFHIFLGKIVIDKFSDKISFFCASHQDQLGVKEFVAKKIRGITNIQAGKRIHKETDSLFRLKFYSWKNIKRNSF
jgi:hypothetical protein